ncbi:hypothetical protein JCM11251_001812 [Rhodosporidiobolus azoricus]
MQRSVHPYAQQAKPPPPVPSAPSPSLPTSQLPSTAHPPPLAGLPPLPYQQGTRLRPSASSTAPSTFAQSVPSASSSAERLRGSSFPASSRHDPSRSNPFDDVQWTRPPAMRRQSSGPGSTAGGTVSRRIVVGQDGREREETREERRARKESERAARGGADEGSLRRRDQDLPPPPIPSSSIPLAPPIASSSATQPSNAANPKDPPSTSSKSVLTIALQRAQSAVLLDSANNFSAAISAYSQSVRLLKEVMARVEDGSREMERKLSSGGAREGESQEEYEKRRVRYEKKEKAKLDEARRLRVIHDTYEDRIRMLVQMGTPLPPNTILSPSIASLATASPQTSLDASASGSPALPTASSAVLPNGTTPRSSAPALPSPALSSHSFAGSTHSTSSGGTATRPPSMVYRRHRADREVRDDTHEQGRRSVALAGLPTVSTPPTSFARTSESSLVEAVESASDDGAEGIGAAMLVPSTSSAEGGEEGRSGRETPLRQQPSPQIGSLPVFSPFSGAVERAAGVGGTGLGVSGAMEGDQTRLAVSPRPGSPGSADSQATPTGTAVATPQTATGPSPLSSYTHSRSTSSSSGPPPSGALPPVPPSAFLPASSSAHSLRSTTSVSEDEQPLYSALSQTGLSSGWPSSTIPALPHPYSASSNDLPTLHEDGSAAVDGERTRRPSFASLAMRRGSSASALTSTSDATFRGGPFPLTSAGAGGESMRRAASAQSAGSNTTLEIRPRPSRSASLAGSAAMGLSLSSQSMRSQGSQQSLRGPGGAALVNSSVGEGSIIQRRQLRSPQPGEQPHYEQQNGGALPPPAMIVRAPSSEVERLASAAEQFAGAPGGAGVSKYAGAGSGYSASTLPGRLRALSQPGSKRPKLQSFESEQIPARPPLPPLLSQANRSVSSSHTTQHGHGPSASVSSSASNGASRKGSVPTPTSLYAPQQLPSLGRSNSSSSIGSSTSSAHRQQQQHGAAYPNGGGTDSPSSGAFPPHRSPILHHGHHPSLYGPPSATSIPPPTLAPRETSLSVPPARRPFHLMRLLVATIPSSSQPSSTGGGYLSEKLFVPSQIWTTQAGSKLLYIETKVRMLDLLSTGLDALERAGKGLLLVPLGSSTASRAAREEAGRFSRELEAFEGLAEGIQSTLGKKLGAGVVGVPGGGIGGGVGGVGGGAGGSGYAGSVGGTGGLADRDSRTGRKGSTASFSAWSNKLSMSLNRVTNGVSLDSQATYVDAIAKVFKQAQYLDHHLSHLFPSPPSPTSPTSPSSPGPLDDPSTNAYALLPPQERHRLERHLRRASEFFGTVICRFVLRDTGVLLDKYVKRGGAWLSAE